MVRRTVVRWIVTVAPVLAAAAAFAQALAAPAGELPAADAAGTGRAAASQRAGPCSTSRTSRRSRRRSARCRDSSSPSTRRTAPRCRRSDSSPSSRRAARSGGSRSIGCCPSRSASCPTPRPAVAAKYGDKAAGIGRLPWLVQESYARLVEAMKASDKQRILRESDTIAGLMVDLHTAVNLTENFDGQKTGQHGLSVRLTDKLPQALGPKLKLSPDAARYLDAPKDYVFEVIVASYVWLDNMLYLEELAKRGKAGYGEIYFEDLARRLGPIVRERLSRAAEDAGSYWYTAWTDAGRPELK